MFGNNKKFVRGVTDYTDLHKCLYLFRSVNKRCMLDKFLLSLQDAINL